MAKFISVLCFAIALLYMPSSATSTSWLLNAPRTLVGLATSASSPSGRVSFIADLRKKQEKSARLQENDLGVEALPEENSDNGDGNNEASPSLLQKKINKILTKLRLIAQIKNSFHAKPEVDEPNELNFNITSTSQGENATEKEFQKLELDPRIAKSENIQHIPPKEDNEPIKIDIEVNRIDNNVAEKDPKNAKIESAGGPNRLGALGVFLAELVGTVVGLSYGAFAQITSGGQSPVTASTSEGL